MDEIPPEVKEQLEEQKKNCPFCKIVSGEIPSKKVYEDNKMIGILDINPCVKGHTLLLPNEHYPIMPLIPRDTFKHLFGYLPKILAALKEATLTTGANALIANGGVAGQQSPHFMVHLIPREKGDWLDKYEFLGKKLDENQTQQAYQVLSQNIPIMLKNHFSKNPANFDKVYEGEHSNEIKRQWCVYEDEKTVAIMPEESVTPAHLKIFSKEEKNDFENLDYETASHMFYVASFCATAVFEGLKAHGTNIILKTGLSDDNKNNELQIHVLPRFENDGLELINPPMESKPDMDGTASKIKEQMFYVEYQATGLDEKKEKITINFDKQNEKTAVMQNEEEDHLEEVRKAIKGLKKF